MAGCIRSILMCVKFGDDSISSLDFSFIGEGVPSITARTYWKYLNSRDEARVSFLNFTLIYRVIKKAYHLSLQPASKQKI